MQPNKTIIKSVTRRRIQAGAALAIILVAATAATGCGSSSGAPTGKQSTMTVANVERRPSQGVVEALDAYGDTVDPSGNPIAAPREVDITDVSIARDGKNLKFTMEVAGKLPDTKPADTGAVQWGFMLDTNGDGKPDWGIFARMAQDQKNWSYGLYNQTTQAQQAGAKFPGTFSYSGSTLTFTLDPAAIGSPASFKWMAFTDDIAVPVQGQTTPKQGGDKVPDNAWPLGNGWLDYP